MGKKKVTAPEVSLIIDGENNMKMDLPAMEGTDLVPMNYIIATAILTLYGEHEEFMDIISKQMEKLCNMAEEEAEEDAPGKKPLKKSKAGVKAKSTAGSRAGAGVGSKRKR